MFTPLAVCAEVNEPQAPALPQVTVQSAPLVIESFVSVTLIAVMEEVATEVGRALVKTIMMGGAVVMVMTAVTNLLLSAVEAAFMVTVLPVGTAAGAMKVVAVSLAVCAAVNEPHAPALPQVTLQSTPAFVPSLATCALTITELPT